MNRPPLRATLGAAVLTTGLVATTAPAAYADPMSPGWDDTFVIDSCPFPIQVHGDVTSSWVDHSDGSVTQTVDGVRAAAGRLQTVYYGHCTRVFPDGIPGPIPFEGNGKTVDICQQLSPAT